jgi:hypothetical protein
MIDNAMKIFTAGEPEIVPTPSCTPGPDLALLLAGSIYPGAVYGLCDILGRIIAALNVAAVPVHLLSGGRNDLLLAPDLKSTALGQGQLLEQLFLCSTLR